MGWRKRERNGGKEGHTSGENCPQCHPKTCPWSKLDLLCDRSVIGSGYHHSLSFLSSFLLPTYSFSQTIHCSRLSVFLNYLRLSFCQPPSFARLFPVQVSQSVTSTGSLFIPRHHPTPPLAWPMSTDHHPVQLLNTHLLSS